MATVKRGSVKRINIMDAIVGSAEETARGRTAVVRKGVAQAAPAADGTVQVLVGGAIITAFNLASANVVANDVVTMLCDTDVFWVLGKVGQYTAPAPSLPTYYQNQAAMTYDTTAGINPQMVFMVKLGLLVVMQLAFNTTVALNSDTTGNLVPDVKMGTLAQASFYPRDTVNMLCSDQRYGVVVSITTAGVVSLTSMPHRAATTVDVRGYSGMASWVSAS